MNQEKKKCQSYKKKDIYKLLKYPVYELNCSSRKVHTLPCWPFVFPQVSFYILQVIHLLYFCPFFLKERPAEHFHPSMQSQPFAFFLHCLIFPKNNNNLGVST